MPPALTNPATQLALAAVLGAVGVYLLLPKPRVRSVAGGVFFAVAAVAVLGLFAFTRYGQPMLTVSGQFDLIGSVLFWLFATAAVGFGVVLVTQRNPARGAIAFAFVVLSTCGLFLLLAAPFLMVATVIIYAGAIVVTFLFVLMLSNVRGASDENDRTREPLLGSLAGFAFVGLLLFTLHLSSPNSTAATEGVEYPLPAAALTADDRKLLATAHQNCVDALAATTWDEFRTQAIMAKSELDVIFTTRPSPEERLKLTAADPRTSEFLARTEALIGGNAELVGLLNNQQRETEARKALESLRDDLTVYRGNGLLPARNVANIGHLLYSEYLLAVEMAGTLLLVATIGAVAIAQRRKEVAA